MSIKNQIYDLIQIITSAKETNSGIDLYIPVMINKYEEYRKLIEKYPDTFSLFGIDINNKRRFIRFNNKNVHCM